PCRHALDEGAVGDVADEHLDGDAVRAALGRDLLEQLAAPRREHKRGAPRREIERHLPADARGGSGDDGDAPAVYHIDPSLRLRSRREASVWRRVDRAEAVPRPAEPARQTWHG